MSLVSVHIGDREIHAAVEFERGCPSDGITAPTCDSYSLTGEFETVEGRDISTAVVRLDRIKKGTLISDFNEQIND